MDHSANPSIAASNPRKDAPFSVDIAAAESRYPSSLLQDCMSNPAAPHTPQFSVVIPTFNRGRLVQRAIESVLGQTVAASQIIVVDDGSTDNTKEVCGRYGNAIDYVRQANLGVSTARNSGIRLARHLWTAFLDSDDYWTPTHLEKVSAAIEGTSGQARYYFTDMRMPNGAKEDSLWTMIGFEFSSPFLLTANGTAWLLSEREPCSVQCTVFNTETLRLAGGFNPCFRVTEDRELFCRLGINGAICAVNTVGCVQTADDDPGHRLGGIVNTHGASYWEHECLLWMELLGRFSRLKPEDKRGLRYSLAVAYWRLSRLHWRSGRIIRSAKDILYSARAQPAFFFWLLRHGKSYGWETSVFPPCRANRDLSLQKNVD